MSLEPDELLGRTVGPFALERLLGHGGFAWVFAARRHDTGASAAVKILKPRYAGDRQFESRFRNEFQIARQLAHPRIVRIHEVGQDGQVTYFGMDLYPDSLGSLVEREGPLPEGGLCRIAIDVLEGLAFAHAAGIVHRDIKVDNILLAADGSAVIADFGISRAVSSYVTATGVHMTIGTPGYVSPEQAQGRPLDGRSDLYALGVTLYKGATGALPFNSRDWFELARMHVEEAPPPPRSRRPALSGAFERVILRCLAKHPDDRYPSAGALAAELGAIMSGGRRTDDIALPDGRRSRVGRAFIGATLLRRHVPGWVVAAAAVGVVAVVALVVVWLGR